MKVLELLFGREELAAELAIGALELDGARVRRVDARRRRALRIERAAHLLVERVQLLLL